jgi:hypothetical protein
MTHFNSAALDPTAAEVLDAFEGAVLRHGVRPTTVGIDAQSAVKGAARLLAHAGISVGYYPPPSAEERELIEAARPPHMR